MSVLYPEMLWFLLLLLPIILISIRNYVMGRKDIQKLTSTEESGPLLNIFLVKWFFSELFFLLFLVFSILSLAGFSWGESTVEEDREGLEMVLLVDVSRSMLAGDIQPNRLNRTASYISSLVQEFESSRFSVVVFKGNAVQIIPMTEDVVSIQSFLESLGPGLISSAGTNIEAGIEKALAVFPKGSIRHKTVILFSDGEELSGNPSRLLHSASQNGIPIFSVGAGTREGAKIILPDGTAVRDKNGNVVVSLLDEDLLTEIAERSGGTYISMAVPNAYNRLVSVIRAFFSQRDKRGFRLRSIERYNVFLFLAILFLVVHTAIRLVKWKKTF
jgi:Ca-activated chloride channel family protein